MTNTQEFLQKAADSAELLSQDLREFLKAEDPVLFEVGVELLSKLNEMESTLKRLQERRKPTHGGSKKP